MYFVRIYISFISVSLVSEQTAASTAVFCCCCNTAIDYSSNFYPAKRELRIT